MDTSRILIVAVATLGLATAASGSGSPRSRSDYPDSLRPFPPEPYAVHEVEISLRQEWTCSREVVHTFLVSLQGAGRRSLIVLRNGKTVHQGSQVMTPSRVSNLLRRFYRDDFFNWRKVYPETDFWAVAEGDTAPVVHTQVVAEPPSKVTRCLEFTVGSYSRSVSWSGDGPYFVKQLFDEVTAVGGWTFGELLLAHCDGVGH